MQKKRKAQDAFVEPKPRLSAFAAAKARAAQLQSASSSGDDNKSDILVPKTKNDATSDPTKLTTLLSSFPLSSAQEAASEEDDDGNGAGYSSDDQLWTERSSTKSYRASQPRQLSTFRPNKSNVLSDSPDRLVLKLKADETATFVGEYDLQVVTGIVMVYGAAFRAGDVPHRVFAPSTHALPPVTAKGGAAEIAIVSTGVSMQGLSKLSPLWGRIWNARDPKEGDPDDDSAKGRSFMLLRSSTSDPLKRSLTPLEVDQDIQSSLRQIVTNPKTSSTPAILISGPKASGKSTISRWLTNTYLTSASPRHAAKATSSTNSLSTDSNLAPFSKTSFWLDLDPGQPEFSAPGQVSLVQLSTPILGPPFTHPTTQHLIRSHTLASMSPKEDSDHFVACALDLLSHYLRLRSFSFPDAPLVVNCSGWVLGSAVDVLLQLVRGFPLTDVVLMQPMDGDVVQMIEQAMSPRGKVLLVPQKEIKPVQSRTSAEFRAMMGMSYFHSILTLTPITSQPEEQPRNRAQKWDTKPLSHMRPWKISYTGPTSGIYAILSYGEAIPPSSLSTVLNSMVVAICVIEENAAFPGLASSYDTNYNSAYISSSTTSPQEESQMENTLVARTPEELPYLLPDRSGLIAPLDPRFSRCLGLGLIRGIDTENKELHLLTPISAEEIAEVTTAPVEDSENDWQTVGAAQGRRKNKIVLVRGKFDSPDWALLEDAYAGIEMDAGVGRPYVSERKADRERSLGGNVWRVRHLPRKMGGGGEGGGGGGG